MRKLILPDAPEPSELNRKGRKRKERTSSKRRVRNTSSKGRKAENMLAEALDEAGYLIHKAAKSGGWAGPNYVTRSNDIFGAFDIVAVKRNEPVRFIQVTHAGSLSARMKKVLDLSEDFFPIGPMKRYCTVEAWGWVGGGKRIDRRYKKRKVYVRRQYWRRYELTYDGWADLTNPSDGWVDHGGANPHE